MIPNIIGFSIVICTHNGVPHIFNTLKYLDTLNLNVGLDYEVIIVDNQSSTDSHSEINHFVTSLQRQYRFSLFKEPQKGKDFALLFGIKKSKYNWIIVCDDDNYIHPNYIIVASSLISKFSDVVLFGSRSIPCFPHNSIVPNWFFENSLKYACGKQYKESGYVSYRQDLWGAGSIIRKDVLLKVLTSSSILLSNMRGEDTEIFYRIIILGYRVYYSNDLCFSHQMTEDRLILENHLKMMSIDEKSKIILTKYNQFIKYYLLNTHRILNIAKWSLVGFIKYLGINLYDNDNFNDKYLFSFCI